MRLRLQSHNHCFNENVIDMEPYDDTSSNTIYIVHNNVIICLKPEELDTLLHPSPLERPDDNEGVWTEEQKDPVVYYWNIQPVPNRINFEKSAVRIFGLETYVDREELMFLFGAKYNTIALGIPKRNYEGGYPEEIDTFFEDDDDEENVNDFERTGLGTRRAMPLLPNLDPPLTENVYRCYPISRIALMQNWEIIDITAPTKADVFTLTEDPNFRREWGEIFDVDDATMLQSIQIAERNRRPIRILKKENSFPIVINQDAIPFLKRRLESGNRQDVQLVYREGMYHLNERRILESSFPKTTGALPSEAFSVTNQYDVRKDMTADEFKEWMIQNEGMRGMDEIVRSGVRHVEIRGGNVYGRMVYGSDASIHHPSSIRPASVLTSLPSDPLSLISSFLDPRSERELRSAIPDRSRDVLIERPLLPFLSELIYIEEISDEDYKNGRFDYPHAVHDNSYDVPELSPENIERLMSGNWKLSRPSSLVMFIENRLLNIDIYIMLIKLHLLGRIKNCSIVHLNIGRQVYHLYLKHPNIIPSYLNRLKTLTDSRRGHNLLILFLYWLIDNRDRLVPPEFRYPKWCLEYAIEKGVVETVYDYLKRADITDRSIPFMEYYQYVPIFINLKTGNETVSDAVQRLLETPVPSEEGYQTENRLLALSAVRNSDDFLKLLIRTYLQSAIEKFNITESMLDIFGVKRTSFATYIQENIGVNIESPPLDIISQIMTIELIRKRRDNFCRSLYQKYRDQINTYRYVNRQASNVQLRRFVYSTITEIREREDSPSSMEQLIEALEALYIKNHNKLYANRRILFPTFLDSIGIKGGNVNIDVLLENLTLKQRIALKRLILCRLREEILGQYFGTYPLQYVPFESFENNLTDISAIKNLYHILEETASHRDVINIQVPFSYTREGVGLKRITEQNKRLVSGVDEHGLPLRTFNEELNERGNNLLEELADVENIEQIRNLRGNVASYERDVETFLYRIEGLPTIEQLQEEHRQDGDALRRRVERMQSRLEPDENIELYERGNRLQEELQDIENEEHLANLIRRVTEFVRQVREVLENPHPQVERDAGIGVGALDRAPVVERDVVERGERLHLIDEEDGQRLVAELRDLIRMSRRNSERVNQIRDSYLLRLQATEIEREFRRVLVAPNLERVDNMRQLIEDYSRRVQHFIDLFQEEPLEFEEFVRRTDRVARRFNFVKRLIHPIHGEHLNLFRLFEVGANNIEQIENRLVEFERRVMEQFRADNGNNIILLLLERLGRVEDFANTLIDGLQTHQHIVLRNNMVASLFQDNFNIANFEAGVAQQENEMNQMRLLQQAVIERNPERIRNPRIAELIRRIRQIEGMDEGLINILRIDGEELVFEIGEMIFNLQNQLLNPDVDEEVFEARVDDLINRANEIIGVANREREERNREREQRALGERKTELIQRLVRILERPDIDRGERAVIVEGLQLVTRVRRALTMADIDELFPLIERYEERTRRQ